MAACELPSCRTKIRGKNTARTGWQPGGQRRLAATAISPRLFCLLKNTRKKSGRGDSNGQLQGRERLRPTPHTPTWRSMLARNMEKRPRARATITRRPLPNGCRKAPAVFSTMPGHNKLQARRPVPTHRGRTAAEYEGPKKSRGAPTSMQGRTMRRAGQRKPRRTTAPARAAAGGRFCKSGAHGQTRRHKGQQGQAEQGRQAGSDTRPAWRQRISSGQSCLP